MTNRELKKKLKKAKKADPLAASIGFLANFLIDLSISYHMLQDDEEYKKLKAEFLENLKAKMAEQKSTPDE